MTDKKKLSLSRRQALGGLGAIGLAGAGAGLGTSALFSDEETFENNSITAGTLDLVVDYETSYDFNDPEGDGSGEINGNPGDYSYVLSDVKPGDEGSLRFCPKVQSNPGWVYVGSVEGLTDFENGQTEPEAIEDATGSGSLGGSNDGSGEGDLSEAIQVTVSYCDKDGNIDRELNNPDEYTLADLATDLESGFLLDGDTGSSGTQAYPASSGPDDQQGPCLCIEWEIPTSVGNEIQSDAIEMDVTFAAYQERNNPDPTNPFVDIAVGSGDSLGDALASAGSGDVIGLAGGSFTLDSNSSSSNLGSAHLTALRGASPTVTVDSIQFNTGADATVAGLDFDLINGGVVYAGNGDGLRFVGNTLDVSGGSNYGLRLENPTNAVVAYNEFNQDPSTGGNPQAVLVSDGESVIVRDNVLNGPTSASPGGQAILISEQGIGSEDIEVLRNDIDGWDQGVFLFENNGGDIRNVTIVGNEVTNEQDDAIEALDNDGSDGFEDINGEDSESDQEAALLSDNNLSGGTVSVSD